ncbi:hypothetical protein BU24DRAFT_428328 [Aaosphaeria arxii CBS 175.79]|uniref:Uncharacterized protein n=1 Tax=Aaosphaeria arxii CBS 175.79 TaxID=1450172 RepID=A0A6A5X907_9PLEO|nr:uncharacterized protein BU24DRAFT_428328 [Aaosphaeria arxii CBS 175.79]KAF2009411.1 hypothetical protein BU24DRAFT_428328 [Aaosphaeria arxii CBS 175.79]
MRMKSLLRDEKRLKFAWEDIDYTWQRAKKDHTQTMQELKYTQRGLDSDLARQSGWAMKQLDSSYYRTRDQTLAASEAAQSAVNTYGQVFCRELCDTIQRKLPTELQVQIYDYVRGPAELQIGENSVTIASEVGKITYLVDFDNPHGLQLMPGCSIELLPHYRNAEYMGREVVDRYFTVDLFHSLKFASQTLVEKFLSSDVLHQD